MLPALLWQMMRFSMLQLLKNLRTHGQGKEITDADILQWANKKVKDAGKSAQMDSFKVSQKHLPIVSEFLICFNRRGNCEKNIMSFVTK